MPNHALTDADFEPEVYATDHDDRPLSPLEAAGLTVCGFIFLVLILANLGF